MAVTLSKPRSAGQMMKPYNTTPSTAASTAVTLAMVYLGLGFNEALKAEGPYKDCGKPQLGKFVGPSRRFRFLTQPIEMSAWPSHSWLGDIGFVGEGVLGGSCAHGMYA